jgi:hypothetical protein
MMLRLEKIELGEHSTAQRYERQHATSALGVGLIVPRKPGLLCLVFWRPVEDPVHRTGPVRHTARRSCGITKLSTESGQAHFGTSPAGGTSRRTRCRTRVFEDCCSAIVGAGRC